MPHRPQTGNRHIEIREQQPGKHTNDSQAVHSRQDGEQSRDEDADDAGNRGPFLIPKPV